MGGECGLVSEKALGSLGSGRPRTHLIRKATKWGSFQTHAVVGAAVCRYNRKGWQEGGKVALGGGEGQLGRRTEGRVRTRDVLPAGVKKPWFLGTEASLEGGSGTALGVGRAGGLGEGLLMQH